MKQCMSQSERMQARVKERGMHQGILQVDAHSASDGVRSNQTSHAQEIEEKEQDKQRKSMTKRGERKRNKH